MMRPWNLMSLMSAVMMLTSKRSWSKWISPRRLKGQTSTRPPWWPKSAERFRNVCHVWQATWKRLSRSPTKPMFMQRPFIFVWIWATWFRDVPTTDPSHIPLNILGLWSVITFWVWLEFHGHPEPCAPDRFHVSWNHFWLIWGMDARFDSWRNGRALFHLDIQVVGEGQQGSQRPHRFGWINDGSLPKGLGGWLHQNAPCLRRKTRGRNMFKIAHDCIHQHMSNQPAPQQIAEGPEKVPWDLPAGSNYVLTSINSRLEGTTQRPGVPGHGEVNRVPSKLMQSFWNLSIKDT